MRTLPQQSALNLVSGLATTLGGFLSTIFVARLLGVEGTGIVAFATWIVTIVVVAMDLGLSSALVRFLPELRARGADETASDLTRQLFRRQLLMLLATATCFAAYATFSVWENPAPLPLHADSYRRSVAFWAITGVACLTQGLASFTYGYLKGAEAFGRLAIVAMVSGALQIGATVIGATVFGIAGAMTALIVGHVVAACMVWTMLGRGRAIPAELQRRVNRFALGSWTSYVVTAFAWSRMEIFFLERSWGSEATGLFSVSLTLANLATQAPLLLTGALLPYMARHNTPDTVHKSREAYVVGMRLMAFLIFPACFGIAAIAPRLVPILFGPDFASAVPTTVVLVSTAAFGATGVVATTYLFSVEHTRVVVATGALGAGLSVLVGLLIIPYYGPMAAATGRGTIQILTVAVAVWYIHRQLHCAAPYGALARLLLAAILCGASAFLVMWSLPEAWDVAAAILTGAVVYFVMVKLLRGLPASDIERLAGAASAILPRRLGYVVASTFRMLRPL